MHYTLPWLLQQAYQAQRIKYLFFWGHKPSSNGSLTATCLSQWWVGHPFSEHEEVFLTAEHYMMAGKARLFGDEEMYRAILASASPGEAKDLGRKVRNFDQRVWEAHRLSIVAEGSYLKFSQHEDLKAFLLSSQDRVLVEASPRDRIWGIGLGKDNPDAEHPDRWRGKNLLGFCLMEARDRIQREIEG